MIELERKIGKKSVQDLLTQEKVIGVHEYPRSAIWHEEFRRGIIKSFYDKDDSCSALLIKTVTRQLLKENTLILI